MPLTDEEIRARHRRRRLRDGRFLAEAYRTLSARQIADDLGTTQPTVLRALRRHGIPVRPVGRRPWPHR